MHLILCKKRKIIDWPGILNPACPAISTKNRALSSTAAPKTPSPNYISPKIPASDSSRKTRSSSTHSALWEDSPSRNSSKRK